MRIKSSFRDYYDHIQAHGQDQTLVYVRESREVNIPNGIFQVNYDTCLTSLKSRYTCVGFCGRVYPMIVLSHHSGRQNKDFRQVCHTASEVDEYVSQHFNREAVRDYHKGWRWRHGIGLPRDSIHQWFDERLRTTDQHQALFLQVNAPVFISNGGRLTKSKTWQSTVLCNPCLKELDFFRLVDPYTAFQDIAQYLSGVLGGNEKPIPAVSDEDLLAAKGFDAWSFRKPPRK